MDNIHEFTKEEETLFLKIKEKLFEQRGGISLNTIDLCYDKRDLSKELIFLLDKIKVKKHLIRTPWKKDNKDLYVFNKDHLNNVKYKIN